MTAFEPTDPARAGETRGVPIMILGGALAVLGPLFGLLGGAMAGSPDPDSTGHLFQYFVIGLLVGAVGVVIVYLGFVRYQRGKRKQKETGRG